MAATAESVEVVVYDGTTDNVLELSNAADMPYHMAVLPYDKSICAMVSIWARTATASTASVTFEALGASFTFTLSTTWQRLQMKIPTPTTEYVDITPASNATLYFYKCMVESKADHASEWVPAPEDGETALDDVREYAESAINAINSLAVGGVNLVNDSALITITGTDSPATSYKELASDLLPGEIYTLSMASAILTAGSAPGMTLEAARLPDTSAGETNEVILFTTTMNFSGGHQKYTFVTADDGHTYALRIYAGIKGSSNGRTVTLEKVKLEQGTFATMWTESLDDTETKLRSLTSTLTATAGGLEDIVSHVTENVDGTITNVKAFFKFDGTDPNNPKLIIGTDNSPMTMELTNSKLSFLWRGDPVAYFSNNKLYVTNVEAIERMSIGTSQNGYLDIVTTAKGVGFVWR